MSLRHSLNIFFSGFSFVQANFTEDELNKARDWFGEYQPGNIFVSLLLFSIVIVSFVPILQHFS